MRLECGDPGVTGRYMLLTARSPIRVTRDMQPFLATNIERPIQVHADSFLPRNQCRVSGALPIPRPATPTSPHLTSPHRMSSSSGPKLMGNSSSIVIILTIPSHSPPALVWRYPGAEAASRGYPAATM